MRVRVWHSDNYAEHGVLFDQPSPEMITYLKLVASEIVTKWSRQWPAFGDEDEQLGFYINNDRVYKAFQQSYPDLEYYQITY
jgi:hypothetical protein